MMSSVPKRLSYYYNNAEKEYKGSQNPQSVYNVFRGKYSQIYDYPTFREIIELLKRVESDRNNKLDVRRYDFILHVLNEGSQEDYKKLEQSIQRLSGEYQKEWQVCLNAYSVWDILLVFLQNEFLRSQYPDRPALNRVWVMNSRNIHYLRDAIRAKNSQPFVVIESDYHPEVSKLMFRNLATLGKAAFYLTKRDNIAQPANEIDSMNPETDLEKLWYLFDSEKDELAHSADISQLLYLVRAYYSENDQIFLFADGHTTEALSQNDLLKRELEEICGLDSPFFMENTRFLRYGDYLSYLEPIFQEDCHELLAKKPAKKFSIVIPVRNSVSTLRYTLKTCLEQTYQGNYEILISDNSTENNAAVFDLCREWNDPRIKYIKTPRDLHLPKSFEYAFLHTSGEYVVSIGADDGLLPWALTVLDVITGSYPDENIVQWERGFYAWPGFNGGQENQFNIPRAYESGELNVYYKSSEQYFDSILTSPGNMYGLPLLYINSCFKRSYMSTLLEKTGRLWDGMCQDIYMGIVNICINPNILNVVYPLTIAGMSSNSEGATGNTPKKTNEEYAKLLNKFQQESNMGGYCHSYYESLLPENGTDVSTMYASLLRMVSIGVLPESYLKEKLDWRQVFMQIFQLMNIRDIAYDKKMHDMRFAAMKHGRTFLRWFDRTIYHPGLKPRMIDEDQILAQSKQKTYVEGSTPSGGLILDASRFGVSDIYGAVQLFSEKSGLG